MDTDPATPQAARDFLDARAALFRAIEFDQDRGISGNRIADMVYPAISRPIVQSYLAARKLHADTRKALRAAGLDGSLGVGVTGEVGRGSRTVYLTLAADPAEIEQTPDSLLALATAVLGRERIGIGLPSNGGTVADALWDGETVQLIRPQPRDG